MHSYEAVLEVMCYRKMMMQNLMIMLLPMGRAHCVALGEKKRKRPVILLMILSQICQPRHSCAPQWLSFRQR